MYLLKMHGHTDPVCDGTGCNVQAELCHTKALSAVPTEGGRGGERENPQGENMTSMCVGNGHAGEGNESTRRGNNSLGLMGHWGSLSFSTGKGL